jgi:hypothetical protein
MNSAYIWMAISALAPVIRQVCDFSSIPSVDQINGIEGAVLSPPSGDTITNHDFPLYLRQQYGFACI